jgi:molecular chaperone HtpG
MAAAKKKRVESEQLAGEAQMIPFSAEISKVLHLMIHSLYTNKDIFLRELISNASDACDKLRYEAQSNDALLKDNGELAIEIAADKAAGTLTIFDNGIGMNREDLITHLGTIARSGTQEFSRALSGDTSKDVNLIGQFGVGFYSAFMVADRVTVQSSKAGESECWCWESDGLGSFTLSPSENHVRGTRITLTLKEEAKDYLDSHRLRFIVTTYSDHIAFPIYIAEEGGERTRANDSGALWTRPKSEISDEQYQSFYRHVAHSPEKPWMVLHNKVEGALEYTNLLFIPAIKPFDLFSPERKTRVKLYVKRVFITDEGVEIVPPYLRFLRGVIDSQDLPLNISRETLQKNAVIDKIQSGVTSRVLTDLKKRAESDSADYASFWQHFGAVLKEGLCEGNAPREKIFEACRFYSTHSPDALTSLDEYIARMKEGQEAIYFITGETLAALNSSPQIEGFKARGIEVLLLTDHVDDFWVNVSRDYKGKSIKSVIKSGEDLKDFASDDSDTTDKNEDKAVDNSHSMQALVALMKRQYGEAVKDVRVTYKLKESPVCLAVAEGDMDMRMERFLLEHKQLPTRQAKILEINPTHPIISALAERVAANSGADGEFDDTLWLLLDQANIAEGEPVSDMAAYMRRVNALMGQALG